LNENDPDLYKTVVISKRIEEEKKNVEKYLFSATKK
jgi:hypothetical protein